MKGILLEFLALAMVLCIAFYLFPGSLRDTDTSSRDTDKTKPKAAAAVVDTHSDTLIKIIDDETWLPTTDIGDNTSFAIDIPKLKKGNVDVQYFAAFTSGYYSNGKPNYSRSNSRILSLINTMYWVIHKNPLQIGLAKTIGEIRNMVANNKICAVLAIEGAYSLNNERGKELLRQYYDLGVRAIGLTWNYSNSLGEGASNTYMNGTPSKGGLTELGKEIVNEMNRLGIIIDVSHMNEKTFWDVLDVSNKPVIASHSGAYALREHARNLKDEQIRAIAEKGGTVQIVFYPEFLVDANNKSGVKAVADHIEHIINVAGIDHVGIGSDFDGAKMSKDLEDASMLPGLVAELKSRDYSEGEIEKIMGENIMRVMEETWKGSVWEYDRVKMPIIRPKIAMGQGIGEGMSVLSAEVETVASGSEIDPQSPRVIVDGKVYIPEFNPGKGAISLRLKEPLMEKFHVVTFYVATEDGKSCRETRIFYIQ